MNFLALSTSEISLIILGVCIIPIAILMVYAIVVALRRAKLRQGEREVEVLGSEDETQRELFLNVFGGLDNITNVTQQVSRITIDVVDIEKVSVDELQGLGASGVLLVGSQVKCSFGDRASYIYELLKNNKDEVK